MAQTTKEIVNDEIVDLKQEMDELDGPEQHELLLEIIEDKGVAFTEEHFKEVLYDYCEHIVDWNSCLQEDNEECEDYQRLVELVGKDWVLKFEKTHFEQ